VDGSVVTHLKFRYLHRLPASTDPLTTVWGGGVCPFLSYLWRKTHEGRRTYSSLDLSIPPLESVKGSLTHVIRILAADFLVHKLSAWARNSSKLRFASAIFASVGEGGAAWQSM
jgi:hypothetical protein